jgi:DNA-directed RNA polymerase subunit RPC12/RpoP
MIPTIQNPVYKCSICGKEEEQKGAVSTGIPDYWVCRECRSKMKKITVTRIIYEDGYAEVSGECLVCGQFPCRHSNTAGEFVGAVSGQKLECDIISVNPHVRKRWLIG